MIGLGQRQVFNGLANTLPAELEQKGSQKGASRPASSHSLRCPPLTTRQKAGLAAGRKVCPRCRAGCKDIVPVFASSPYYVVYEAGLCLDGEFSQHLADSNFSLELHLNASIM